MNGLDDAAAAADLLAADARRAPPRRAGDRLAPRRRRPPPLHLPRAGRALAPPGQRAGRARRRASATASPRWPGTATATWSCTTRCRGSGAVLHTLNPRLHPDQVVWIADHAEDQVLFFDLTFLPLIEAIAARVEDHQGLRRDDRPRHMPAAARCPNLLCYEELIEAALARLRLAGVRREHAPRRSATRRAPPATRRARSTATARRCCTPTRRRCPTRSTARRATRSCRSCRCSTSTPGACRTSPAWSAPSWCSRARSSTARACYELFEAEGVTLSAGVPTVWQGLLAHVEANNLELQHHAAHHHRRLGLPAGDDAHLPGALRRAGAARLGHDRDEPARHGLRAQARAPALGLEERLARAGQAGPRGVRRRHEDRRRRRPRAAARRQGLRRAAGARAVGRLAATSRAKAATRSSDGWFPDRRRRDDRRRRLHADHRPQQGRDQVRRRVDRLDRPREHRDGAPRRRDGGLHRAPATRSGTSGRCWWWCRKPGAELTRDELLRFYDGKIAKWWTPDDVVFVDAIPLGATGKMQKNKLREQFKDHRLPTA